MDFFHVAFTSKITFASPLTDGSVVIISYFKGKTSSVVDNYGKVLQIARESFIYNGGPVVFTTMNDLTNIVSVDVNGLIEIEFQGYEISGTQEFTLLGTPAIGSTINIIYLY